jgi:hypothetical protein
MSRYLLRSKDGQPKGHYLTLFEAATACFKEEDSSVIPTEGRIYELIALGHIVGYWDDSKLAHETFVALSQYASATLVRIDANGKRRAVIWTAVAPILDTNSDSRDSTFPVSAGFGSTEEGTDEP